MAVNRPDRLVAVGNAFTQVLDEIAVELWNRIAHRVGNIDGGRTFTDNGFNDPAQKVRIRTIPIFGAELDISHEVARKAHRHFCLLKHLIGCHAKLFFHVQGTSCQKEMQTA